MLQKPKAGDLVPRVHGGARQVPAFLQSCCVDTVLWSQLLPQSFNRLLALLPGFCLSSRMFSQARCFNASQLGRKDRIALLNHLYGGARVPGDVRRRAIANPILGLPSLHQPDYSALNSINGPMTEMAWATLEFHLK